MSRTWQDRQFTELESGDSRRLQALDLRGTHPGAQSAGVAPARLRDLVFAPELLLYALHLVFEL